MKIMNWFLLRVVVAMSPQTTCQNHLADSRRKQNLKTAA